MLLLLLPEGNDPMKERTKKRCFSTEERTGQAEATAYRHRKTTG